MSPHPEIHPSPNLSIEAQIQEELSSEKAANAYDSSIHGVGVGNKHEHSSSSDLEHGIGNGRLEEFFGEDQPYVIPEGVDPNFIRREHVRRGLKQRHIQMMTLAGAIGTGLFLGSGRSIRLAGPAGALIGYGAVGVLVMCVMGCLAELSALAPISGSYVRHAEYFFDPALSFSIRWVGFYAAAIVVPSEWVAVAVIVQYWTTLNSGIIIMICIIVSFASNIFLIRIFGEIELFGAMLKIALILGLILFGLIYDLGGVPGQSRLGFQYWRNPGAFGEGFLVPGATGRFLGFLSVFLNSVYAYASLESVAIAAAETKNPRRNIPKAAKNVFIRVVLFYLVSLFIVGLIVPSNDPQLLQFTGTAASSPWTIAANRAGVKVLPSIINAVVITSAFSSGNHSVLQGSRSLYALALQHKAPQVFARVSRWGIPWVAVSFESLFMLLAFMSLNNDANTVFGWLQNLSSTAILAVWIVIGFCSLRMRYAMKKQGIPKEDLPYATIFQPYLAWVVVIFGSFILLTGGFYNFVAGNFTVSGFFSSYFTIPLVFGLYFFWKIFKRTKIVPLDQVPVSTFIKIANANPEEPPKERKGILGWFAAFWWD